MDNRRKDWLEASWFNSRPCVCFIDFPNSLYSTLISNVINFKVQSLLVAAIVTGSVADCSLGKLLQWSSSTGEEHSNSTIFLSESPRMVANCSEHPCHCIKKTNRAPGTVKATESLESKLLSPLLQLLQRSTPPKM